VFDPHIDLARIYGANRQYAASRVPQLGSILERSLDALLGWADCMVLTQQPPAGQSGKIAASNVQILDLSGRWDGRTSAASRV
jgi:GDP-mannose 6-dehydrogenase